MTSEMAKVVRNLYATFARYPCPDVIESCPCGCTKPDAIAHLVALPLRELRLPDLLDFCFSALTTQGSINDFRYLLPRLLQGISEEPCGCNAEILFGKLDYAKWLTWPEDEIAAVRAYLRILWCTALNAFPLEDQLPAFFEIETVLASIAITGESLDFYLTTWTETATSEADQHLLQFVTMFGSDFSGGRTFTQGFWARCQPQAAALRRWLLRPDTLQRIRQAAHLLKNDGFEHLFQPAVEALWREKLASKLWHSRRSSKIMFSATSLELADCQPRFRLRHNAKFGYALSNSDNRADRDSL